MAEDFPPASSGIGEGEPEEDSSLGVLEGELQKLSSPKNIRFSNNNGSEENRQQINDIHSIHDFP